MTDVPASFFSDDHDDFYPGIQVEIREDQWRATGDDDDPLSRLHLRPMLRIGGIPMHLEAHAVTVIDSVQVGVHPWNEEALSAICQIYDPGGHFTTMTILDRDYVLIAFPHA